MSIEHATLSSQSKGIEESSMKMLFLGRDWWDDPENSFIVAVYLMDTKTASDESQSFPERTNLLKKSFFYFLESSDAIKNAQISR